MPISITLLIDISFAGDSTRLLISTFYDKFSGTTVSLMNRHIFPLLSIFY